MRWSYLCQSLLSLSQGHRQREDGLIERPSQFKPGKYCGLAEVCPGRREEDSTVRPGPSFSSQAPRAGPEAFFRPTSPGRTGQGGTVAEHSLPQVHLLCVNVAREPRGKASLRHQDPRPALPHFLPRDFSLNISGPGEQLHHLPSIHCHSIMVGTVTGSYASKDDNSFNKY